MSALARPEALASSLLLAALTLHPALHAERWLPGRELLLVVALVLAALGLLARALEAHRSDRIAAGLLAAGALLALAGAGLDGLRGRSGTLTLAPGQALGNFEERGPGGRSLGLRPLGFVVGCDAISVEGAVLRLPGETPAELTRRRALAVAGFRLADPRPALTGDVERLRVAVSDGQKTDVRELLPGRPARVGDLVVSLEQYFPDFALDQKQQPFTRSLEPRNPAALLSVEKAGRSYRAFVLQSMPGVHRVEPLGLAFSLLEVEPEQRVTIQAHSQPFAPVALLGGVLLLAGLVAAALSPSRPAPPAEDSPLIAAATLLAGLLLVGSGSVLRWTLALQGSGGGAPLAGVGVLLGIALLSTLAGALLLAAARLAPVELGLLPRALLWAAVLLVAGSCGFSLLRAGWSSEAASLPLVGLGAAAALLAATLWRRTDRGAALAVVVLVTIAVAWAIVAAIVSTSVLGTYATPRVAAAVATALVGLLACEPTAVATLRRLALLVAMLALLVLPA